MELFHLVWYTSSGYKHYEDVWLEDTGADVIEVKGVRFKRDIWSDDRNHFKATHRYNRASLGLLSV